ncbi:MAG TPA: hypothetical protein IAC62_15665 [Candidatus Pelethocola excrementipullorum]|nr:hypothetical protein [Candidatus Pelethocola excrementipullorum]
MSDKQFQLKIITPIKVVFDEKIKYLLITTSNGKKGILYNHESCIELLSEGDFKVVTDERELVFKSSGGTLYLEDNHAVIVAEMAALSTEYDTLIKERIEELSRRYSEEIQSDIELKKINIALRRSLMKKS